MVSEIDCCSLAMKVWGRRRLALTSQSREWIGFLGWREPAKHDAQLPTHCGVPFALGEIRRQSNTISSLQAHSGDARDTGRGVKSPGLN